jgi:hypothetical protein
VKTPIYLEMTSVKGCGLDSQLYEILFIDKIMKYNFDDILNFPELCSLEILFSSQNKDFKTEVLSA